jgi:hypothetical protein
MGILQKIKELWEEAGNYGGSADTRSLDEKIAAASSTPAPPVRWTKEQFSDWLETLEDPISDQILLNCKRLRDAGKDYMDYLHQIRRKVDADAKRTKGIKKIAAKDRDTKSKKTGMLGGMNIFDIWWAWDEACLMGDQREFFARENREARERRLKH